MIVGLAIDAGAHGIVIGRQFEVGHEARAHENAFAFNFVDFFPRLAQLAVVLHGRVETVG